MKRIISSLIALAMVLSLIAMPVSALKERGLKDTVAFTLDTVEAEPDTDISVSFSMEGEYAATALTVFIDYDSTLLTNKGALKKDAVWYDILDLDGMVQTNVNTPGRIGFMAIVPDGDFSSNGVVFTINFHVSADAAPGTTIPLAVTISQFTYDELSGNVIQLPYTVTDGAVVIPGGPDPTPTPEPSSVSFVLETVEAEPDTDVNVAFSMEGEYAATALTVFVDYDSTLLTNKGALKKGAVWYDILDLDGMVQTNVNTPGRIGFMAIVPDGDFSSNGVVFTINFHVSAEAAPGTTIPLTVTISQFTYDELSGNVIQLPYTVTDGAVVISEAPIETYTVTWKNWDGSILKTEQVDAGQIPEYSGETPTKAFDDDYHYTFSGWDPAPAAVTGNVTYTAQFTAEAHSYTEVITTPATCTETGVKAFTCACGHNYTETIPALGHTPGEAVIENRVEATCTTDGSYDSVVYCTVCGAEISRETITVPALGHDWSTPIYTWADDRSTVTATRTCTRDTAHVETETVNTTSVTTDATCTEDGNTVYTATFTNPAFETQTTTVAINATGHTDGAPVIENEVAATCTTDGGYDTVVYCSVCGAELSREHTVIPATGHIHGDPVHENELPATCETDGHYDNVVYCTVCGEELSRETVTIPALGHSWGNPTYTWAADSSTVTATRVCANDPAHVETETVETVVEITPATCTEAGNEHYTATFTNTAFETQTKDVAIPAPGHTPGAAVTENVVPATCTTDGSYDSVVYCSVCGEELSRETITIPALGHTPGEAVIENEVAATCETEGHYDSVVYCTVCGEELSRETITVPATGHTPGEAVTENEVAATCTTDGGYDTVIYCTVCGYEISREHTTIPAIGHAWGEPTYVWAEDNSTVTATRVCANDADHIETETVNTTSVTTEPTCSAGGNTVYTATFTNPAFETQTKTVASDPIGHIPGEPVIENRVEPTCTTEGGYDTVTYCSVCGVELDRVHTVIPALGHTPGEAVHENEVAATCETEGHYDSVVYCTVCDEELSRETITVPATGHNWGEPVFNWAEDHSSCTATIVCANDPEHTQTLDAVVTSEITKPATGTEPGETTYTATVIFNGVEYTDTVVVADIPVITYTVTWKNWDGTVLEIDEEVPYGTTPEYNSTEPTRASTAQYDYTFTGWTPELVEVTGDATYTAVFEQHIRSYTITYTINGEEYTTQTYEVGAVVTAPEYTVPAGHTFSGWDVPATMPAENITLDASLVINTYTVTFIDGVTGEVIAEVVVEYGSDAEAPEVPDHGWYIFTGWDGDFTNVTSDITVTSTYWLLGDVDGDGEITSCDALQTLRYAMNILDEIDSLVADVNGDGIVNSIDALLILRYSMGLI